MSRVLCIDDEAAILRLLTVVLARGGHEAVPASSALAALTASRSGRFDAVLLDLGLPDRDGLELIPALLAVQPAPIIVLSARSDVQDKVAALDLGAADFVTKPFDGEELLARLRVALRRPGASPTSAAGIIAHGPITLDIAHHAATLHGQPVALTPREFAVLRTLTEAGGRILTHASLLETVWGKAHRDDVEYLRVVVRALRLKLEADPAQPTLIRNEPGIGYRLG